MAYKVVIELENIQGFSPLEAAQNAASYLLEDFYLKQMTYIVQDENTKEITSVDLSEDEEDATLPYADYQCTIQQEKK